MLINGIPLFVISRRLGYSKPSVTLDIYGHYLPGMQSKAVTKMIEKYKPMLGLHGHIHESRGIQNWGRTVLMNPGSEYSEGILRGVLFVLKKGKIKDYVFTSG